MSDKNAINNATTALETLFLEKRDAIANNAPAFLNERRGCALESFLTQGVPSKKVENYKYTNLVEVFDKPWDIIASKDDANIDIEEVFECDVPDLDTFTILMVNGWYYPKNNLEALPEGVTVCSLQDALNQHKELVEEVLCRYTDNAKDPVLALNGMFAQDGLFVHIAKNVVLERPLQVINLLNGDSDRMCSQRNVVLLEQGSQAKIAVCDHTLSSNAFVFNNMTEVLLKENASLDIYNVQNQNNQTINLSGLNIEQQSNSNVLTHAVVLHGGVIRNNLTINLNGENANAKMYGISVADQEQHVDNFTTIYHSKPHCTSNQVYKNVMSGNSEGVFTGCIHVLPYAEKTAAFQQNNSLLLTDSAQMNAKPQLIIDNDDVKCSHGATVGQIDEEALFYLRTRGIGEDEARLMMIFAFAHDVLSNLRIEPLRDRIDQLLERRLRGEDSPCDSCAIECNS
ncbi:Fe-S cluster assembly protein SufD [Halosquirtibacter xylanolyticus]|uniref:Fe-S cluster assembly protein SufD n=1 Tax=Halosquirtibacter xylanolyticus TaxID=3374599 RepID=UPI00374A8787|nr:Fe-S cluster assembly protein SufD [Prolixibacteraceae bacterium]